MRVPECFILANVGTWISFRLSVIFSSGGLVWPILPSPLEVLSLLIKERFQGRIPSFHTRRHVWCIHLMHKPTEGLSAPRQGTRVERGEIAGPPSSQGHQPEHPGHARPVSSWLPGSTSPGRPLWSLLLQGSCRATSQL